jgi:four helix bundle protein
MELKENPVKDKCYRFALRIIRLYQYITTEKKEFVLAKQVLKSGTAIGALVEEALQGESRADFIHKLSIANKEANETNYWLRLLRDSQILDAKAADSILADCQELIQLLTSIIKTTRGNPD